jgi:hypothetical protein
MVGNSSTSSTSSSSSQGNNGSSTLLVGWRPWRGRQAAFASPMSHWQ